MDTTVLNQVLILLLIIVTGYICRKKQILNDEAAQKLTELVNKITMPFLIIVSFQLEYSYEKVKEAGVIILFAVAAHFLSAVFVHYIFKGFKPESKAVMSFAVVFTNCAYMGFPVLEALMGRGAIFYASFYIIMYQFFAWSYGVMLFKGRKGMGSIKDILLNPGIASIFIGLILFIFSIKLPYPVYKALDITGSITIPVSMLLIGFILAGTDIKSMIRGNEVYLVSFIRLAAFPLAALAILYVAGMRGMLLSICVLLFAMPSAANTAIFAGAYGGDRLLASKTVVVSTLLSILTIPLFVLILQAVG